MTEKCQPARSEEADRLVTEFLDQIIVRDASGDAVSALLSIKEIKSILADARFPTIPDELRESLHSVAERAWNVDPDFESELLTRYLALPDAIQNEAGNAYKQRLAAMSPIDKFKALACKPDDHPTEATLVAKMYLDGREITRSDAAYVGNLLETAAEHGNAEAAYLLATAKVPVKHSGNDVSLFLTNSEYLRNRYRRQAREGNFRRVFEDEANAQYDADDGNEDRLHYLQEKLADDESCKTLERCVDETETITPMDMAFVGEAKLKHAKHIEEKYEWLLRRCSDTRSQVRDLRIRAEYWLRKAANFGEAIACFLVAENFCTSQEERFSFLKSAAFPGIGISGYSEAASPLACEFLMNPKSEHFDAEAGEHCLREYLASCPQDQANYLFLDDGNAANCLADWLLALPAPTAEQKAEAFAWYKRAAESEFGLGSPHALIRAGLMALRGEGCSQDHDLAKTFLKRARRSDSDQARDKRASKYADITLRLGWEAWALVAEELFELAEETEFLGDPLCPLTPEDVSILATRNPHFKGRSSDNELQALRGRLDCPCGPFGEFPIHHLIIEGLIWALQPSRKIPRERLAELWGDSRSMVASYAWSRLELASRISGSDMATLHESVKSRLESAISLGNEMLEDRHREPLKFGERELVLGIAMQARRIRDGELATGIAREKGHISEVLREQEVSEAREDERRQLISFLSHTLTSATAGGSKTVRKIASKLAIAQANVDLPDVAQRLAAQVSRMARVESLVEVFKLYTSDDKALREGWNRDTGGEFSVLQVCAMAVQQALLRFYFSSEHEADFARLMPEADYATVAQEFMTDALALDMSTPEQARKFIGWAEQRLPFLRMSFAGAESAHLAQGGARDIVIFALTGEFLGNALKYAAAGQAITLDICVKPPGLEIVCRNAMKAAAVAPIHGGKTGLTFIRRVCTLINAEFDEPAVNDNVFILRALLPIK
jgi:TPR repeat protein